MNVLALRGLYGNYTHTLDASGSGTVADTRPGAPDGTDILDNFQGFHFADGLALTTAQMNGAGVVAGTSRGSVLTSSLSGGVILRTGGNNTLTPGASNPLLDGRTCANTLKGGRLQPVAL